jgi:D-alanyl-D-alanine carboxypeptidase
MLACAALVAAAVPAIAQVQKQPSAATAATPAESAARAVLAAINGTDADRSALVENAFTDRALQNESAAARLKWLEKIAADSGGLTVVSWAPQGERMVEALVRSNRGGKFGKLVLFTAKAEPAKIADIFLLAARDPAKVKAEAWPAGPLALEQVASEIEKRASALAEEDSFSGVVLVAKGDRILVNRAYGLADQEWAVPNRADTAFHLGSVGKMFTAAAILRLAESGKLTLDDPLSKWVPEYPHANAAPITLKHLLTHSGGLGEWDGREFKRPMTGAEKAATMTAPLQFTPGEKFIYSNAGFVLLQAVIEKATGKSYADALDQLVFQPSGMTRSGLWPVTAIVPNRATGYLRPQDDPMALGPRFSNEQFLGYRGDGSGGHYSTASDMFAFIESLASGRLLGARATAEMLQPRIDFVGTPRPSKYGYGVHFDSCGGNAIFGHEGGGPNSGVSSLVYRTVESGWTVIVLSNYDPGPPGDLALSICEFVASR